MEKGRALELFFIDGRPDGMLTAEVFNWTGHILRTPRTQIKMALQRSEAGFTGIYVLLGDKNNAPCAYIGEAEILAHRLKRHVEEKDWWENAILITTSANNLHKAHVQYLESRLVEIACRVGKIALENNTAPKRPSLSEADRANMESFLETLSMVLPAIGVELFLDKSRPDAPSPSATRAPDFILTTPKHGIEARAFLENGEWIVRKGSTARKQWAGAAVGNYDKLHKELVASDVLRSEGKNAVFTRDFAFSSPSAAAAVINGRSTNGRTAWVHESTRQTFAEWEEAQLKSAP